MIFFDVTKVSGHSHRSGIVRVSQCLRHELARMARGGLTEVAWSDRLATFVGATRGVPIEARQSDWLITPELFSEHERPGFSSWVMTRPCRVAAVYHDSIPLQYPEFTWPQSVTRHPHYLKMLACMDLVIANSNASAREIWTYWEWLGVRTPELISVTLGADGVSRQRVAGVDQAHAARRNITMVGILEPRKNQDAVLDAAEVLWEEGHKFVIQFMGRVNPHFGRPVAERIRDMHERGYPVRHLQDLSDERMATLLRSARFSVLPSLAEGCGLPVLESLWGGIPVLCSDVPSLAESAEGGGCKQIATGDVTGLTEAMRAMLTDDTLITRLAAEACSRPLPVWSETARGILSAL